jgi:hypothetical protein
MHSLGFSKPSFCDISSNFHRIDLKFCQKLETIKVMGKNENEITSVLWTFENRKGLGFTSPVARNPILNPLKQVITLLLLYDQTTYILIK